MRIPAAFLLLASAGSLCHAQTLPADRPVFEVASIKASPKDQRGGWVQFPPGGRLEVRNAQFIFILQQLYGVRDYQIVDAPKWIVGWDTSRFDIEAKAEGVTDNARLRLMARNLLEDRFRLKVHRETRELPVYALTPGKDGLTAKAEPSDGKPRGKGYIEPVATGWLRGDDITMDALIRAIGGNLDRPVVDRTGYTEKFSFSLKWSDLKTDVGASDDSRPPLPTAIQQQLGLKLVPQKAPVEVLVVDHVERPSQN